MYTQLLHIKLKWEETLPNIKAYYIATVIKTAWNFYSDRHKGQRNSRYNLEIDPHKDA